MNIIKYCQHLSKHSPIVNINDFPGKNQGRLKFPPYNLSFIIGLQMHKIPKFGIKSHINFMVLFITSCKTVIIMIKEKREKKNALTIVLITPVI